MVENLQRKSYDEIVSEHNESPIYIEIDGKHTHVFKFRSTNGRFAHLLCRHCGKLRSVINPRYLSAYVSQLEHEVQGRLTRDVGQPPTVRYSQVERDHIRQGLERYEGNIHRDLLQPYNPDGSVNMDFVKEYGGSRVRQT